jgi:protein-tyrosine phosphatase
VTGERSLDWEGCLNVRDLGGLPAAGGRTTRWGAVVRGDAPDRLGDEGWAALRAHGIRTIVDLRNDDERPGEASGRPGDLTTVHLPLDGVEDTAFWDRWASGPQFGTPLYYRPHLDRFPERSARVIAAVARAEPGGVLVHCVGGRDRTGQIAMLLLALAGVDPEEIAADYALSPATEADDFLGGEGTSARELIVSTLAGLDVAAQLRRGGLAEAELAAVRARLVR